MSNTLNSEDFGIKIYNRFPPKYREDDVGQNYALKRYLESLSDGGFKYSIDEINGITTLIDPDRVDSKVLPVLFQQYGLEIFNGIPEEYLRYLLPKLGEAWSKKGSLSVVEFITSSLSGVKVSTDIVYKDNNPIINVKLEMDYNLGDYVPEAGQFIRLLNNFVPFYCDVAILYAYFFYDSQRIFCDDPEELNVIDSLNEHLYISGVDSFKNSFSLYTLEPATLFMEYTMEHHVDDIEDNIIPQSENEIFGVHSNPTYFDTFMDFPEEKGYISIMGVQPENTSVLNRLLLGKSVLGVGEENSDQFTDIVTENLIEDSNLVNIQLDFVALTNNSGFTLNNNFCTTGMSCYDKITVGGKSTIVY